MSTIVVNGSALGTPLQSLLMADSIQPGAAPSYEICKTIYLFHPLGAKIVEKPVRAAQSQERKISVPDGPEDLVKEKFLDEQDKLATKKAIFATRVLARVYGIASMALKVEGQDAKEAVDWGNLWKEKVAFSTFDPLNTAGSLVLNQDALAFDFQHAQEIRVQGATFHRSKARVVMNEFPIYISYTPSAFGFVGRSAYQRALFPLKSFIQTMITDDLVSVKAGVLVAKMKSPGSVITEAMGSMFGFKRNVVKEAVVSNVISIDTEETIETLNFQNLDGPMKTARHNIIENTASAVPMPAKMLTEESFAEGFGEGSEDAKELARFVDAERLEMKPLYDFCDQVIMHRAWNSEWYKEVVQKRFPEEYGKLSYHAAFYKWKNSFKAEWPNLLIEPESEQVRVADVKFRALIAVLQALAPMLKGEELATAVQWVADNMNEMKLLFGSPLVLDYDAIAGYVEEKEEAALGQEDEDGDGEAEGPPVAGAKPKGPPKPKQFTAADSADRAIRDFKEAVAKLPRPRPREAA